MALEVIILHWWANIQAPSPKVVRAGDFRDDAFSALSLPATAHPNVPVEQFVRRWPFRFDFAFVKFPAQHPECTGRDDCAHETDLAQYTKKTLNQRQHTTPGDGDDDNHREDGGGGKCYVAGGDSGDNDGDEGGGNCDVGVGLGVVGDDE